MEDETTQVMENPAETVATSTEPAAETSAEKPVETSEEYRPLEWEDDDDVSYADNTAGVEVPDADGKAAVFSVHKEEAGKADSAFTTDLSSDALFRNNDPTSHTTAEIAKAWCEARNRLLFDEKHPAVVVPLDPPFEEKTEPPAAIEPAPRVEKVGSLDAVDDGRPDADLWHDILEARKDESESEDEVASLAEQLKEAKKTHEAASKRLGKLIDESKTGQQRLPYRKAPPVPQADDSSGNGPGEQSTDAAVRGPLEWTCQSITQWTAPSSVKNGLGMSLLYYADRKDDKWLIDGSVSSLLPDPVPGPFDSIEAAQAACQQLEDARFAPAVQPVTAPDAPIVADESWRAVRIDSLEPKLKPAKLKVLAESDPPILTIGDLTDYQAAQGEWWWKKLKGFGDGGMEQIAAATDRYWAEHPLPKTEKPAAPKPIEPEQPIDPLAPVTAESLGIAPGVISALCHADLLPRLQVGQMPDVRTVSIKDFTYVVTLAPEPAVDDCYALRPLTDPVDVKPNPHDPFHGKIVKANGVELQIGKLADCLLVVDAGT